MKLFKAEPVESKLKDDTWGLSSFQGTLIVRAMNLKEARLFAAGEFARAHFIKGSKGDRSIKEPWLNTEVVRWMEFARQ